MIKDGLKKSYKSKGVVFQVLVLLLISFVGATAYNLYTGKLSIILEPYTPPPSEFEEVDLETLKVLMEQKMAILIDARVDEDYQAGHIEGALNLSPGDFQRLYSGISENFRPDLTLVIYCSTETCTDSNAVALMLKKKGHKDIMIFKGGYALWQEMEPSGYREEM